MKDASHHHNAELHQVCQQVVCSLIEKYQWTLLTEDELIPLILDDDPPEVLPTELERRAKNQYTSALYEACRQAEDPARREQGYRDLFRFLYRAAYNRWPDLAEVVAQRAMVLVYEQIDRCYSPTTFLSFAMNKLRQACTDELREQGKDVSLEDIGLMGSEQIDSEEGQVRLQTNLDQQERLQILVEAIQQLTDERQQQVILLKFFEGLSDEAISARLQVSAGNVRVLRTRGLTRLRKNERLRKYFQDLRNHVISSDEGTRNP